VLCLNAVQIQIAALLKFATQDLASMHALSLNVVPMLSAPQLCMILHVHVVKVLQGMEEMDVYSVSICT
jgi:hypothetical protein